MEIASFYYDKHSNNNPKHYVVEITYCDREYLEGYDLLDGAQYKKFICAKMSKVQSHGIYQGFDSISVVSENEIFDALQYNDASRATVKDLQVDPAKLADLYCRRTGRKAVYLTEDKFLLLDKPEARISVHLKDLTVTMLVREGVVQYFDEAGKAMTELEFTRKALQIKD